MALFLLIALVMVNFAANSVLSRAGIDVLGMDALSFSTLRLASGAAVLALLVGLRRAAWPAFGWWRFWAAGALMVYLVPFTIAYVTLPSGLGALVLFGVVQLTMFGWVALSGSAPRPVQWLGMALSMAGLAWLLWPSGAESYDMGGLLAMAVAGVGWGVFSLMGRGSADPLGDMAWSFVLAFFMGLLGLAGYLSAVGDVAEVAVNWVQRWPLAGVLTAIVCGGVTSGLGYALWYRALPQIPATTGAVAQLTVPIIAIVAGALILGEAITLKVALASGIVLGGIALTVLKR